MVEGRSCPSCAAPNPERARFCMSCGAGLAPLCSNCGTENPPEAKFCIGCGNAMEAASSETKAAPAAPAAPTRPAETPEGGQPPEERRQATVLFADLSGYTAAAEQMDPEAVKAMVDRTLRRLAEEIERFGGSVDKFIGDN